MDDLMPMVIYAKPGCEDQLQQLYRQLMEHHIPPVEHKIKRLLHPRLQEAVAFLIYWPGTIPVLEKVQQTLSGLDGLATDK